MSNPIISTNRSFYNALISSSLVETALFWEPVTMQLSSELLIAECLLSTKILAPTAEDCSQGPNSAKENSGEARGPGAASRAQQATKLQPANI
jgi:hypothetical protein